MLDMDHTFLVSHGDGPNTPKQHEIIDVESELVSTVTVPLRQPVYWTPIYLFMVPIGMFMAHFFFQVVIGLVFNAFGPTKQLLENSVYYSARKPKQGVVDPTVKSIQRAITEYELQGGTVNIFINDDGMQNLPPDQALTKMKYYAANNIGWIARPPHKKDGFIRQGRFKKASNMNYCLDKLPSCNIRPHIGENVIAFFSDFVYRMIRTACACGESAPFVGHNAFLRWSAIKSVVFEEDGIRKFWSDSHVSEDFDMALRLQIKGFILRYASYSDGGFQEGVSLTYGDEIKRWEKYAFGCALITYVMRGLFYDDLDNYFLDPFQLWLCLVFVFSVFVVLSTSIHYYRASMSTFFGAMFEFVSWLPFFFVFFAGLSFHCSMALLARMFNYNIQWGATAKELKKTSFSLEFRSSLIQLWKMYIVFTPLAIGIFLMAFVPPDDWKITDVASILPFSVLVCAHILAPILLNPTLTLFIF
ncbi:hypothetical protein BCR33DRAFT_793070 [Rhizoclosmatium globosum]|uniref:Glycosyltransferase 2-like domain-containing protein n=1 Tax=Rhizoclosmatium globosum TaxID=329046 RepID=A0A1Y2B325_9FUNG|nr:hypothetical protein BCR33DRAFT_793070 [Rhizoclosmatium globosum]|eukprot:ORY29229.1 hypothetical protein BCR33DRAFT_793070 [Rhizoclosmatium globosum]